jgi:uncharacterized membrane protein YeiH
MKYSTDKLLLAVDLIGTLVFAVEGAMAAINGNLDFFGIMVLGFVTALGGGIIRDLLIGAVPPNSIRDWRYPAVAFTGAAAVFFFHQFVQGIPSPLMVGLDAAGLSLFAVAGAGKALEYNIHPFIAALMGGVTGVGGGTMRDVLLAQVPAVLNSDVYAVAAITGAAVMIVGLRAGWNRTWMASMGACVCFLLRVVSVWQHWNLPKATQH